MWKNGKAAMTMSCSPKPSKSFMPSNCWRFATRLRCVSMTPLGKPVVPLEYGSATTSRAGVDQLPGELVGGIQRIDGGAAAAERRHRVEHHRVLGNVRAVDRQNVA